MPPPFCTTPPGQRVQSISLSSAATASSSSSTSSTTIDCTPPSLVRAATPESFTVPSPDSSPRTVQRYTEKTKQDGLPHRSVYSLFRRRRTQGIFRWLLVLVALWLSLQLILHLYANRGPNTTLGSQWHSEIRRLHLMRQKTHNPVEWLRENSFPNDVKANRPKAALISLVRNEELDGILQSMRQLEFHWNQQYNYPWIFFNEKPFSEEFKAATSNATCARTEYHLVPRSHWTTPPHINQTPYYNSLDYLSLTGVGKGHLLSYHAMIRWQSGLFYLHPALEKYDYYWRVEPDVHFFCDIPYDPFRFMHANEMVYGFNMAILDDARSFASLWSTTQDFIVRYPHLLHPDANLDWLVDPATGWNYNNCQFFSNFEIGSLDFFRNNEGSRLYFDWLDQNGGFYYSRWGDAPVHTLMVSMFTAPEKVWWFRDVGYQHDIARHCPPAGNPFEGIRLGWADGRCTCEPTSLDENFYKLVPMESPQMKPSDTCIRLWLGGEWLKKKEGWSQDAERVLGGDGYGGYLMDGM
ncbi:hypothetical protein G647_05896 [Cladophialophora carrionii CBS 160.54]|uniref:Mannosyltransferase n=1 Tax=Cladophialophora carrionii CBS 160.54 TaxID=1279043 RepID=V9D769_9EURO|nr:uncharacterized protein G647_05896 [Cladophialophora carrionii CBS 160.54]ETI21827.1 hypothetical protein G647_05896 [Cladophialophora carrionii CBS 160.54]